MTRSILLLLTLPIAGALSAQGPPLAPGPSPSGSMPVGAFQGLHWRFVGPYRAGWATVAAGVPGQPNTYYFGSAGGGGWKTGGAGRIGQRLLQRGTSGAVRA